MLRLSREGDVIIVDLDGFFVRLERHVARRIRAQWLVGGFVVFAVVGTLVFGALWVQQDVRHRRDLAKLGFYLEVAEAKARCLETRWLRPPDLNTCVQAELARWNRKGKNIKK